RLIQAAINGRRTRAEHPGVPTTPDQQALAAAECVAAGAGAIHLHVRAPDGRESVAAGDVARAVAAMRGAVPGVPIGVSTGAWIAIPRLLHGVGRAAWHIIDEAATRGYHTRVGFEDILTLPDGATAPSNAALVVEARRRMCA